MFLRRQRNYFTTGHFSKGSNIRWEPAGDHIFKHENVSSREFYGTADDMQVIVQSPSMLDLIFAEKKQSNVMNDKISEVEQTTEEIFRVEISDEALEAAADMGAPSTARTSTCGYGCPCS